MPSGEAERFLDFCDEPNFDADLSAKFQGRCVGLRNVDVYVQPQLTSHHGQ